MSLTERARITREHADVCVEPHCHALANALEGAVDAEARGQVAELSPEPDTTGIAPPAVSNILIPITKLPTLTPEQAQQLMEQVDAQDQDDAGG
jgi:hypothetical protein